MLGWSVTVDPGALPPHLTPPGKECSRLRKPDGEVLQQTSAIWGQLSCPFLPGLPNHCLYSDIYRYSGHWKNLWNWKKKVFKAQWQWGSQATGTRGEGSSSPSPWWWQDVFMATVHMWHEPVTPEMVLHSQTVCFLPSLCFLYSFFPPSNVDAVAMGTTCPVQN